MPSHARTLRRIAKGLAQGGHRRVQVVVEIDEDVARPEALAQILARHDAAWPVEQEEQHLEGLVPKVDRNPALAKLPQHGLFGPAGFVLQESGADSKALAQIWKLNGMLSIFEYVFLIGMAIWVLLTIRGRTGAPRWSVLSCPLLTLWFAPAVERIPAPLGLPLAAGWTNIMICVWFSILFLVVPRSDAGSRAAANASRL